MTAKKPDTCALCEKPLPHGMERHFDAANPQRLYCCRRCFYTDYLRQGPSTALDDDIVFPAFELAQVPQETRIQIMLALDDWIHETAQYKEQQDVLYWHDQFFDSVVTKYRLQDWKHVLIILISTTPWMM